MKPRNCARKIRNHSTIWYGCAAVICGVATATAGTTTTTTETAVEEPTPAANWISFVVGGTMHSGDDAAMMRRTQTTDDMFGGIESFGYSQALGDSLNLTLDGHALPGLQDYEFNLNLTKDDVGYIAAGYREFRTWYDPSGGYVPGKPASWVDLYDGEYGIDRGEVYFEAGLRMEKMPEITFRYTHGWRDGAKDSTSWGGIPSSFGSNKTIPALWLIDEETDTFDLDIAHTLGNTDLALGLTYQTADNEDTRLMRNGSPEQPVISGQTVRDTAEYDLDLFNTHLSSETRFGDCAILSFGYSFTTLDTDIGGDRPSNSNATGALLTSQDHALFAISGGAQSDIHVLNANFWWNPIKDLVVVPSLRAEFENIDSWSNHIAGVRLGANATEQELEDAIAGIGLPANGALTSDTDWVSEDYQEFTEALEVRYSGIENVLLYAEGEWSQIESDRDVDAEIVEFDATEEGWRNIEYDVERQKYTVGANWYPCRGVSINTQAYYSDWQQDYDNEIEGEDAQIDQHNNETVDFNVRVSWRAMPNLTIATRYDYQQSEIENSAYFNDLLQTTDLIESADITRHILSQSVTWSPIDRLYLQGSFSWVSAETDTPADKGPNNVPVGIIPDSDNDYFTAAVSAGYSIDAKTEVRATYTYYGAHNYTGYAGSTQYGYETEEHGVSLTLTRMLTPNMIWNMRYAMLTSNTDEPDQTGGYNDFTAHMISTGLQIRF